jgi:16S rRNA A1518/A1519 N6-dimethyltransferase RsmA/KsgA/DIM1 with predicted DNA glycosylase/AP lyase activity
MPRPSPADDGPQQHDLDPVVAARIVAGAAVRAGDRVLDAGAGAGALTRELLAAGAEVLAIERDPARLAVLRADFADAITAGRLRVLPADLRREAIGFQGRWRVVANPPFNLSAVLVRAWILGDEPPWGLDLMLQREAAEKLTGTPGAQTRSSALIGLAGRAQMIARPPREATRPPSRVDLAVWRFRRCEEAVPRELRMADRLLERAFAGPRTVAEALRGLASAVQLKRQGAEHGWSPADHPRAVPPAAWLPLARLLAMCGKLG